MKVCFISASFVREREIIETLHKKVDLLFVCQFRNNGNFEKSDVEKFCTQRGINFLINDTSGMQARSLRNMRPQIRVLRSIKDFKPDVVYVEAWSNPYFALLYNLFLSRQKTIVALMDYKLHQRSKGQLKFTERFYKAYSLTCFHYFQLFSYSQTKYFSQDHPTKKVFTVRLYLVDKDCSKDSIEKKAGVTTFLYFGRIFYYKGVDVLIKAANILGEKRKDFKVIIAGNSDSWNIEYKPLIGDQQLFENKIRFIPREEMFDLFSQSDFFIAPYREVSQSGPLLRAYNYEIIPIVSDEPGFLEYVENSITGFLFKNEDCHDLARVMDEAIELSLEQRILMLKNIEEMKELEFSIERVASKYVGMFQEIYGK